MQTYANALLIAIPAFLILILIEAVYGFWKKKNTLRGMDTISSLSSGITNVVKDSLGLIVIIVSYEWMVDHMALIEIKATWLVVLVGFIAKDFAGYWSHRLAHSINIFWNAHAIHHSSEEFNLPCALRQSISNLVGIYTLFLIPAALLGVPAKVINIIAPLHLFLQFWYHTRHIPKLGWLEFIIITPSQHRVHHAINSEYLDKNLGQIFSFWDRLFGTFQEELDHVPPVYGITRPMATWNPIRVNFKHLWLLMQDAWRASNWWDKIRIWFMPLGWRPDDVAERFPLKKIEDPYHFEKYKGAVGALLYWSWGQLVVTLFLLLYMFWQFTAIGFPDIFVYGGLLFATIYGYTALMDGDPVGIGVELMRNVAGIVWIAYSGGWFGADQVVPGISLVVAAYFAASFIGTLFFISARSKGMTLQVSR